MSVNCTSQFNNPGVIKTTMSSGVTYSGTLLNAFSGAFFRFELIENETISFNLQLNPNTVQPINVQLQVYRRTGPTTYNLVGTSVSDEFYNSFDYSATPGEYFVCLTTDYSINYAISAEFTEYPNVVLATATAYAGEYMPPFEFAQPTAVCDSAVFYQIIEGKLPNGLEFDPSGIISGIPEEQDCESGSNDTPSFTWWEESELSRSSTGLKHRLVIRAALVDAPETYTDREFFICIHNNWDNDRDHFISQKPVWETPVFVFPEDAPRLDLLTEPAKPEIKLESQCPTSTPVSTPKQATLQEIQELAKMVAIAPEFRGLVSINNDGECVVCQEPEDTNDFKLKSISNESCKPCEEPVTIEGLQPLPKSLCKPDVESVEVVESPKYVPGIPEICYPSLLRNMTTTKVCAVRPKCPPITAIYPVVKKEKFKLTSQCKVDQCE